jgi:adenosine deaminase
MTGAQTVNRGRAAAGGSAGVTPDQLRRLPKTDLHVHLDGSLRPGTLVELAHDVEEPLPTTDPAALSRFMRISDARSLEDYLTRFEITLTVMQKADAIERIAFELALDAAAENVWYMEPRFCPALCTHRGLDAHQVLEAALRGLRKAEATTGIRCGIIVCALRSLDPSHSLEMARVAVDFKNHGVVAFDLAGREAGHPPSEHLEAFRYAAHANLAVTIHAGEAYGPPSIHEAVHLCGARRIGHGTRLLEDPGLMAYINDFRIPLEICLTSNVQTRVATEYATHPLTRYLREGLIVCLNTDNRLMSGTTVTDEFRLAHEKLGLTWEQLAELTLMGFESAFLPHREKQAMLHRVRAACTALTAPTQRDDLATGTGE